MLSDLGFTIPVLVALVIALTFALVFDAPRQLVVTMLVLGVFTAAMEYAIRSRQEPP